MTPWAERGSALLAAIGMLCVMTILATMSLMAGGADLAVSARQARERSVFYAAESALETTLVELASGNPAIPEESFHVPWPAPGIPARSWHDGPWTCARRICLIPDVGNADGDPATTSVLFDRSFGYAASPLPKGGFPVFQLLVAVEDGGSRQAVVAEVAPVTCAPAIAAAWTAAGPLDLVGDIRVIGAGGIAAMAGRVPAQLSAGAALDGELLVDPSLPLPGDVLQILNTGGTLARLDDLPEPPAGGAMRGLSWSRGDYSRPLEGEGILVVHNPAFDPVKHEASRLAAEEGILVEGRDPFYSHLDPSRQTRAPDPCLRRGVLRRDHRGHPGRGGWSVHAGWRPGHPASFAHDDRSLLAAEDQRLPERDPRRKAWRSAPPDRFPPGPRDARKDGPMPVIR